ncbi:hypothetical protein ACXR0O_24370 [Verrucomicrobiota bacterium sgz303538]
MIRPRTLLGISCGILAALFVSAAIALSLELRDVRIENDRAVRFSSTADSRPLLEFKPFSHVDFVFVQLGPWSLKGEHAVVLFGVIGAVFGLLAICILRRRRRDA